MSEVDSKRREIMDLVLFKDGEGKIDWSYKKDVDSVQGKFGDFEIHLDKKSSASAELYKIWFWGSDSEILDDFVIRKTILGPSQSLSEYYVGVGKIFKREVERLKADALNSLVKTLKDL